MSTTETDITKLLISGYVRTIQDRFAIRNIPLAINEIIYLYQTPLDECIDNNNN